MASATNGGQTRVLLLSPPSVAAHPERLEAVRAAHDRAHTDIQMLDRLALGLVSLPPATYDVVLLLSDADNTRGQSQKLLDRAVLARVVEAIRPGGKLTNQDGTFASEQHPDERREAILAGLAVEDANRGTGAVKPETTAAAVPLRRKRDKAEGGAAAVTSSAGTGAPGTAPVGFSRGGYAAQKEASATPAGVGFVDFSDDLDLPEDSDEELIDEDALIDESDLTRPIIQRTCLTSNSARSSLLTVHNLVMHANYSQHLNAGPSLGSDVVLARTAHAAWLRKLRPRILHDEQRLMQIWRC
jgi:anamorsin